MKFKMTKMTHEQIDEVNTLLETYGDSLTAFYDEAFWLGAKQGIIDPKFELREAQASFLYIFEMDLQRLSPMSYGRGSRATIDMQLGFRKRSP